MKEIELSKSLLNSSSEFCEDKDPLSSQIGMCYQQELNKKKNILVYLCDFQPAKDINIGGTAFHVLDLMYHLKDVYNFHVIYKADRKDETYRLSSFMGQYSITSDLGDYPKKDKQHFFNPDLKRKIEQIVHFLSVDLIHIHNIVDMFLDIFTVADECHIPTVFTLHDYYTICPSDTLSTKSAFLCNYIHPEQCGSCCYEKFKLNENIIPNWQKTFHGLLKKVDKVVTPSECAREIASRIYQDLNYDVIPHGYDYITTPVPDHQLSQSQINVAFIGNIVEHKGLKYLLELKKLVRSSSGIILHLFGTTPVLSGMKNSKNYIFHGAYHRDMLPQLLSDNHIDVICLLSTWAETYSYTLSESLLAKIPVITFNIGAIAERVKSIGAGWIIPITSTSSQLLQFLVSIKQDHKEEYVHYVQHIKAYISSMKSMKEMAEEYHQLYDHLVENKRPFPYTTSEEEMQNFYMTFKDGSITDNYHLYKGDWVDSELQEKKAYLQLKRLIKSTQSTRKIWSKVWKYYRNKNKSRYKIIGKFIYYRFLDFSKIWHRKH